MAIKVRGLSHSEDIRVLDTEDHTMSAGAIVALEIGGSYSHLDSQGVRRLQNALDMILKNENGE